MVKDKDITIETLTLKVNTMCVQFETLFHVSMSISALVATASWVKKVGNGAESRNCPTDSCIFPTADAMMFKI